MEHASKESGISFATYQRYETDASTISVTDIMLVSGTIGTTAYDIVGQALGIRGKKEHCCPRSVYGLSCA